ncbi:hypothetical protein VPH35_126710 [Triticum aestivum]
MEAAIGAAVRSAIGAAGRLIGSVVNKLSDKLVEAYVASSELGLNYKKIKQDLMLTQGLLHEAQRRGVSDNPGLQGLVQQLSGKADEAEDTLDELHYFIIQDQLDGTQYAVPDLGEGLRCQAQHGGHGVRHTVGNWIPCFSCCRKEVDDSAAVTKNPHKPTNPGNGNDAPVPVDKLQFDRQVCDPVSKLLNIIPHHGSIASVTLTRSPMGSISTQHTLYGRETIFKKTLDDITIGTYHSETSLSVLPIIGPGGIGKTTFTQHLYSDKRMEEHFDVKVWVCVSTDFDVFKLTKRIYDGMLGAEKEESNTSANQTTNLNGLQESITRKLKSKRFLIVFDDIWECNSEGWENLLAPFINGDTKGNMVLVTTRFPSKAEMVKTTNPIALEGLEPQVFFTFFLRLKQQQRYKFFSGCCLLAGAELH